MNRSPVAMFDFDGTVSLIREGWSRLMAELGAEHVPTADDSLIDRFERDMLALSGRPSIVQMGKLHDEIVALGHRSPLPMELHTEFERRLFARIADRKRRLAERSVPPTDWTVPGTHELLTQLQSRGVRLFLVSGTDKSDVEAEMKLLDLDRFFESPIYAPADRTGSFHKKQAIATILNRTGIAGKQLIGFGDGYSETVEVKAVGGRAIGIASVEVGKTGLNPVKAAMLRDWGADPIVPDYRSFDPGILDD
jgi:phosphoglycolate phosphatase